MPEKLQSVGRLRLMEPENPLLRVRLFIWAHVCVYIRSWCEPSTVIRPVISRARWTERRQTDWETNGRETDGQTDMSEVLTVDAILFGLLVFSGIIGNVMVINVVRENNQTWIKKTYNCFKCSKSIRFGRYFYPKWLTLQLKYIFAFLEFLALPGTRTRDLGVRGAMIYCWTSNSNDVD